MQVTGMRPLQSTTTSFRGDDEGKKRGFPIISTGVGIVGGGVIGKFFVKSDSLAEQANKTFGEKIAELVKEPSELVTKIKDAVAEHANALSTALQGDNLSLDKAKSALKTAFEKAKETLTPEKLEEYGVKHDAVQKVVDALKELHSKAGESLKEVGGNWKNAGIGAVIGGVVLAGAVYLYRAFTHKKPAAESIEPAQQA